MVILMAMLLRWMVEQVKIILCFIEKTTVDNFKEKSQVEEFVSVLGFEH